MTQLPQAIAWTLIHFCWQAAAIAAAWRLISFGLARRSSQTRYLVALSALLLMLGAALVTFAWELRTDSTAPSIAATAATLRASIAADFPRSTAPGSVATQQTPPPTHLSLAALLPWIDGLWLVGVFVLSVRSLGGWWYLRRLRLESTIEAPDSVTAAFLRISRILGLSRAITLRLSTAIDSPMTMGTLRAIVLLPLSAVTLLGPEELEVVLAHELAHVRRADFFWNILQTIAETLFFFHPAVWWLSARIRHERELCCDDLALQICPNPVVYAHALVHLEEQRSRHLRFAMALDGHQSRATLLTRIARILGEPMTRIPNRSIRPFSLAAAIAGLVILLIPAPHVLAKLAPAQQTAPVNTPISVPTTAQTNPQAASLARAANASSKPSPAVIQQALASSERSNAELAPQLAMTLAVASQSEAQSPSSSESLAKPHSDYIDQMKAAGYDVDLDKLIAMKIQNVTPEYARTMASAGFGKLSADELISCKIQGVTPEYIAQLKQQGFEINKVEDAVSFRIFNVTPEFVSGMKAAGFDGLNGKQLLSMRVQGVTPEYARTLKQKFPNVTADELVQARIFNINEEFIASASRHGFNNLPFKKLVQLRISGILDDESAK
jgi:beta-lactamase regulating signal transducer with metallopeptidase domain